MTIGMWASLVFAAVNFVVAGWAASAGSWRGCSLFLLAGAGSSALALAQFGRRRTGGRSDVNGPDRSLILQRMELDRRRHQAIGGLALIAFVAGTTGFSAAVAGQLDGFVLTGLGSAVVTGAVYSIRLLSENSTQRRAFETEHGVDAGRQNPV